MLQLEQNLTQILNDKNANLLPENLKQGITCLGVTGTLEAETMPYQELEYIQSQPDGGQILDTGIVATDKTVIELLIEDTDNEIGWERVFGSTPGIALVRGDAATNTYTGTLYEVRINGTKAGNVTIEPNVQYKIKIGAGEIYVNDELISTYTAQPSGNNTMYLFKDNGGDRYGSEKIYYCKIWEDDVLVCDLIPTIDSSNVVCMYDRVNHEFHYNIGTGEFIKGPKINAYTELTYIESTGNQYIDTSIIPSNHKVEIKFQYTNAKDNTALFGTKENVFHFTWFANKWYYACGNGDKSFSATKCTDLQTVLFNNDNNKISINGIEYSNTSTATSVDNEDISLCLWRRPIGTAQNAIARIYYCRIWDKITGDLARYLIPVINNENNKVCMYDKVSDTFFYNLGTEDFISGPKKNMIDTSDATSTVDDILEGKTAYVNGEKITGTIPIKTEYNLGIDNSIADGTDEVSSNPVTIFSATSEQSNLCINNTEISIPVLNTSLAGHIGLTADKIKSGETILGITGTYTGESTSNYTPLQYIESTGTQWINTGVMGDDNMKVEIEIDIDSTNINDIPILSATSFWSPNKWLLTRNTTGAFDYYYTGEKPFSNSNGRHKIQLYRGQIILDDTTIQDDTTNKNLSNYSNLLLGHFSGNTTRSNPKMKIYSCKVWNGEELVRNFIPASVVGINGLYDLVNNSMYSSQSGNYIAGPEITE